MEYWERRQELADRCACEGALCTARCSPAIPYRRMAFFGQELPITPSRVTTTLTVSKDGGVKLSVSDAHDAHARMRICATCFMSITTTIKVKVTPSTINVSRTASSVVVEAADEPPPLLRLLLGVDSGAS